MVSKTFITSKDLGAHGPLYRQIYDRFRNAIGGDLLKPGERIPSARALTKELGLSRSTIDAAYALLVAEGYIQTRGQAGTIVTPGLRWRATVSAPIARNDNQSGVVRFRPDTILPFQMGLPALDAFPRKIWARLGARSVRAMQPADMVQAPIFGLPALRAEIAACTCRRVPSFIALARMA